MNVARCYIALGIAALSVVTASATNAVPFSRQQIAAALSGEGMHLQAEQVELLAPVTANASNPRLRLISIEPWGSHRMKARLACEDTSICLPFYVAINAEPIAAKVQTTTTKAPTQRTPPVLRVGVQATLKLRNATVEITLPVICLENGAVGQLIRVTSTDRKRIYKAEVVSDRLLRGEI